MEIIHNTRANRRLLKEATAFEKKRQAALEAGRVSLLSGQGKLAIYVSKETDHRSAYSEEVQRQSFVEEGERLMAERQKQHAYVKLRTVAVPQEIKLDFRDPEVTDIILIGHGSISCLWANGGRYFDWHDAARAAKYLKQGKIEQRMCGNFPSRKNKPEDPSTISSPMYSVPLGTFTVTDPSYVIAAINKAIPDVDPPDSAFAPVFDGGQNVIDQIIALNHAYAGKEPEIISRDNTGRTSI